MASVELCRWKDNTSQADPRRRVLVLPGIHYPIDRPLLLLAASALAEAGWTIWHIDWDLTELADEARATAINDAAAALEAAAEDREGPAAATVVLGKSIGSRAARWVRRADLPAIWLTPLLYDADVAGDIRATGAPALLVGGGADTTWDAARAADCDAAGKEVITIKDGDHSLYSGDWRGYLRTIEQVTDTLLEFADGVS